MIEVIVIEKSSYFSEKGLIEVEVGFNQLPQEIADYFISIGTARLPDNLAIKDKKKGKEE
jgi:hypothetical protein